MSLDGVGATRGGWPVPEDVARADTGVADLKRIYRRLARTHHPDHNPHDPGATRRFQGIHDAYVELESKLRASSPTVRAATRAPSGTQIVRPDPAPRAAAAYSACERAWSGPDVETQSYLAA
jgi:hypothetical protein